MRLIDADAIKIPNTHADIFENCRNCKLLDAEQVKELIDSAPTIDAVKHGAWIPVDWEEPRRYGCSECHRLVWQLENYCPNCGARMDGEE